MSERTTPVGPRTLVGAGADPQAVLLDVDDTLIDTRAAMRAAGAVSARAAWAGLDDDTATAFGVRYHADPGGFFTRYTTGELTFADMRAARLREAGDHHGLAWGADRFDAFEAAWPDAFRGAVTLFDDVAPFLDALDRSGVRVGLLTNSSRDFTALKLDAVGLGERFDVVATTDTLGYGKPDARAFQHACALLGADSAATVYVGDALDVDARAAAAAGLTGVWLDRGRSGGQVGVPVVASLLDLLDLLDLRGRPA